MGFGRQFEKRVYGGSILPLVGIYDVFSARLAARQFDGVFCSGFGYSASAYGLPDVGYLTWRDTCDFGMRIRHILPKTHILMDVDDGFGDENIASTLIRNLETIGVSAVMLEDQKRPRRCGHYEGKQILPPEEYAVKLKRVLSERNDIFVIARTDATEETDARRRAAYYAELGADGIMMEAIKDLGVIHDISRQVSCPIMVNQIHGGKSPNWSLDELEDAGVSIVIYSTPCLFSAQYAIENYLTSLRLSQRLPDEGSVKISECTDLLNGLAGPVAAPAQVPAVPAPGY
jgi:2-methylisocitrate lyase-like PEP mutase family enzyme